MMLSTKTITRQLILCTKLVTNGEKKKNYAQKIEISLSKITVLNSLCEKFSNWFSNLQTLATGYLLQCLV